MKCELFINHFLEILYLTGHVESNDGNYNSFVKICLVSPNLSNIFLKMMKSEAITTLSPKFMKHIRIEQFSYKKKVTNASSKKYITGYFHVMLISVFCHSLFSQYKVLFYRY